MKKSLWMIFGGIVFAILPIAIAVLGPTLLGCTVNEGNVIPCKFLGVEVGRLAYSLGMMGWFSLLTIPAGLIFSFSGLVFLIVFLIRKSKSKTEGQP